MDTSNSLEKIIKYLSYLLVVAFICVLLLGGSSTLSGNSNENKVYKINPVADSNANSDTAVLYYKYNDNSLGGNFLVSELRQIDVNSNESLEKAIVKQLIAGPQNKSATYAINPDTTVGSVTKNKDCYFVTLSSEFLEPISGLETQSSIQNNKENIKMAVYSIVNSLTELGICSRVQILIDVDNTGNGQRLNRQEFGFDVGDSLDQPLEPLMRDGSMILTPDNCLTQVLDMIIAGNTSQAERYIKYDTSEGNVFYNEDDFFSLLSGNDRSLSTYKVLYETISMDCTTAVVVINVTLKYGNGTEVERTVIPVKMVKENDEWKISYSSLVMIYEY